MIARSAAGSALIDAGEIAERRGEFIEARAAFSAALEDPDPLVVATAHNCLGRLAWQQGSYDASFSAFEKARTIAIRIDADEVRARAEIGLGNVHYARGDYDRARTLYNAVRLNTTSVGLRAKVYLNLGVIANIEGDMATAEHHYRSAVKAFTEAEDLLGRAQAMHNLGKLHADRLDWDEAEASYTEALRLASEAGQREMVGLVAADRSELSCAQGRYAEAVTRCDEALTVFAELGAEVLRGTTLRWKGRALRELGQFALADRALTEAIRIAHRAQSRLLEAEAMQELGATFTLSGDRAAAAKWLARALEAFESLGAAREAEETTADLRELGDG